MEGVGDGDELKLAEGVLDDDCDAPEEMDAVGDDDGDTQDGRYGSEKAAQSSAGFTHVMVPAYPGGVTF